MTAVFDFFAFAALIERRYSKLSHHLTSSFVDGFVNRLLIWIV
jgi:hypothetical protein